MVKTLDKFNYKESDYRTDRNACGVIAGLCVAAALVFGTNAFIQKTANENNALTGFFTVASVTFGGISTRRNLQLKEFIKQNSTPAAPPVSTPGPA